MHWRGAPNPFLPFLGILKAIAYFCIHQFLIESIMRQLFILILSALFLAVFAGCSKDKPLKGKSVSSLNGLKNRLSSLDISALQWVARSAFSLTYSFGFQQDDKAITITDQKDNRVNAPSAETLNEALKEGKILWTWK